MKHSLRIFIPLKRARMEAELTQKDLAELVGVHQSTIVRWESGESHPDPHNQSQLAKIFNKSLDFFDPPSPEPSSLLELDQRVARLETQLETLIARQTPRARTRKSA